MTRIELTDEVVKAITLNCPIPPKKSCNFDQCPLSGPCLEYWTGDDSMNRNESEEN